MKLSRTSTYAIRAVVYLATAKPGQVVIGRHLARTLGMPQGFMLRILSMLSRATLLWSAKGPNGGYRLGRPAKDITLLEVIEAVEGPLQGRVAFISDRVTNLERRLAAVMDKTASAMRLQLQHVRISDLTGKGN